MHVRYSRNIPTLYLSVYSSTSNLFLHITKCCKLHEHVHYGIESILQVET